MKCDVLMCTLNSTHFILAVAGAVGRSVDVDMLAETDQEQARILESLGTI